MGMSVGGASDEPMMDMNTTPLIDVMLVLLIMFIISIPVATHAVNIDLPVSTPPDNLDDIDPVKNKVFLTQDGEILWNGELKTQGELRGLIEQSLKLPVEPELQFEPDANAAYDVSANVLNIIKGSGVTKFGFVGNERYASFGKTDIVPFNVNAGQ